jgi:hypothetical protein
LEEYDYTQSSEEEEVIENENDPEMTDEIPELIAEFYHGTYVNPNLFPFDIRDWETIKRMKLPLFLKQTYVQRHAPKTNEHAIFKVLMRAEKVTNNYLGYLDAVRSRLLRKEFIEQTQAYEQMHEWLMDEDNSTLMYEQMKDQFTWDRKRMWNIDNDVYWPDMYPVYVDFLTCESLFIILPNELPDLLFAAISIEYNVNILIYKIPPIQPMILHYTMLRNRYLDIVYDITATKELFIGKPLRSSIFELLYIAYHPRTIEPAQITF